MVVHWELCVTRLCFGEQKIVKFRHASILFLIALTSATARAEQPLPKTVAKLEAGKEAVRVVCFGDSVTGLYYHTGGRRTYTDMVGIALRRAYPEADITAINAGISGNTTVNGLGRIDNDVLKHKPTLVTVMFGLNDMVRVSPEDYRKNLITIVEKCRAVGAEVLLCTPNSVTNTGGRPTKKLIAYCDVVRDVGRATKTPVCDCYQAYEKIRSRDALTWRLLMSDAIHPNMDGHQVIAEEIVFSATGKRISLSDVGPHGSPLSKTIAQLKNGKPVKILAMPPFDALIANTLLRIEPSAQLDIVIWNTEGKTLADLELDAKNQVRKLKPNLVLIAVPRSATAKSTEQFIHSYAWVMNYSLSFGLQQWDCVVMHPSVADVENVDERTDNLVRQLVGAQDLHLIDRAKNDRGRAEQILAKWLREQFKK